MAKSQNKTAAAEKSSRQERQAREGKILVITACVMGAIILAFVLSILAGQIFQSDWFKQRANAVSVDGEKLSVADYNFFFYRSYYEFLNNVGTDETGMYSSPQADVPLSEQYMDEEKNVTWQDYFDNRAQTLLKDTYAYYHLAQNAGFTLTEEMQDDIQYDYDEKIWFEAVEVGHSTEADYLAQNYGAGQSDRLRQGLRQATAVSAAFSCAVAALVVVFARPLMGLFVQAGDTEVIACGVRYLRIEGTFYAGIGCLFLLYGFYRAVQRPGMSVVLTVVSLGTRVALAYALAGPVGEVGIWAAIPIGWFLADAAGYGYYLRHRKALLTPRAQ